MGERNLIHRTAVQVACAGMAPIPIVFAREKGFGLRVHFTTKTHVRGAIVGVRGGWVRIGTSSALGQVAHIAGVNQIAIGTVTSAATAQGLAGFTVPTPHGAEHGALT